jgi:hypothetical protein
METRSAWATTTSNKLACRISVLKLSKLRHKQGVQGNRRRASRRHKVPLTSLRLVLRSGTRSGEIITKRVCISSFVFMCYH